MSAVVRLKILYGPRRQMDYVRTFVNYLKDRHKGADGGPGAIFTRQGEAVNLDAFYSRLTHDGWAFQVILSSDPGVSASLPLERYAPAWMLAVERHLGRKVDWVGGCHYDEPEHLHIQMLWRGRDLAGKPLRLSWDIMGTTLRELAALVETFYP